MKKRISTLFNLVSLVFALYFKDDFLKRETQISTKRNISFSSDETTRKFDMVLHDDVDNPVAWMNSKALTGFLRRSVEQMHGN